MKQGIAPQLLLSQVQSTAAWALVPDRAEQPLVPDRAEQPLLPDRAEQPLEDPNAGTYRGALLAAPALTDTYATDPLGYLRLLLAAHFVTVATFVPTDVDTRIRHHHWWALETEEQLLASLALVDEAASWNPAAVSERIVRNVCGHHGEWLSVWAGALGRAIAIGANEARELAQSRIDGELAREDAMFGEVLKGRDPLEILRAATVLAHNLGDLSRVIEAWPKSVRDDGLRQKYVRLGHEGEGRFVLAGNINKPIMAPENDRFLALRPARPLRKSRKLLLPIGPFFDAWGEMIAKTELLDDVERGEVVAALLETHLQRPQQVGCLRALAGFDRAFKGGLGAIEDELPSRTRKLWRGGAVREQLGVDQARFEARMAKKLEPFVR